MAEPHPPRVLVVGASGGIGAELVRLLSAQDVCIGAHCHLNAEPLDRLLAEHAGLKDRLRVFRSDLRTQQQCHSLVDDFFAWGGGIDALVQLSGHVSRPAALESITQEEWLADIDVNLSGPFFLAQRCMTHMQRTGGRIVLTSTASAKHGGGATSMAYGVAKAGIECLVKGLARHGAGHNVLVNGIAPGFIETDFHTTVMKRTPADLQRRAEQVPLKRAGRPADVAGLIAFLLSPGSDYITGECISVSGGDWL